MWTILKPVDKYPAVFDVRALRIFVGVFAFAFPIVLPLLAGHTSLEQIQRSISAYYHDSPRDVFVGFEVAIGVLLLAYNGRAPFDMIISKLAGVLAFGVAFVPTAPQYPTADEKTLGDIHNICGFGLYSILAVFCFCLLPNAPRFMAKEERTVRQARRDTIYHVCGWLIVACIVLIGISHFTSEDFKDHYKPVFFLEWIALAAFGISWITAGQYGRLKFLVDEKDAYYLFKKHH